MVPKYSLKFSHIEIQNFWTTSDGETTKTKVVNLKELYDFILDIFSFEIIYPRKIIFEFLTFKIQNFQTTSDGETTKTRVIVADDIYCFAVDTIIIWICLGS
jgi:hypothetical protein